ncbi:MAG: GPGG-motif small membrane protein [Propionicimonas sp.]
MATLLWIVAAALVIGGVLALFRGQMLWGIVLIVVGLLVGPGGVSIFH